MRDLGGNGTSGGAVVNNSGLFQGQSLGKDGRASALPFVRLSISLRQGELFWGLQQGHDWSGAAVVGASVKFSDTRSSVLG